MTEPSPWEKWKENLGQTRPWDILNPNVEYASEDLADKRFDICKSCPELIKPTHQCKKCGCFMYLKTKLEKATCPLGKW
jgi:hypothetical protein